MVCLPLAKARLGIDETIAVSLGSLLRSSTKLRSIFSYWLWRSNRLWRHRIEQAASADSVASRAGRTTEPARYCSAPGD